VRSRDEVGETQQVISGASFYFFKVRIGQNLVKEMHQMHNEELHNLYSSPNIIRMIKSRRMAWAGHVASTGAERCAYRILGKPEGKRPTKKTNT
jgi:hypothetical protein